MKRRNDFTAVPSHMLLYYWTAERYVIAVDRYSRAVFPLHAGLYALIRLQDNEFNQSEDVIGRVVCGIRMCVFVARGVHECAAVWAE